MSPGFYSYLGAAAAYGFFAVLMLFSWRSSLQGKLLTGVAAVSCGWAVLAAFVAADDLPPVAAYQSFEILRYAVWFVFLLKLFDKAAAKGGTYRKFVQLALPLSVGFAVLLLVDYHLGLSGQPVLGVIGQVILSLVGLALVEQLLRNTSPQARWSMKYLFIAVGGIFAFDFYLYADALLFRGVNNVLWESRGLINVIAVPLLAISAARSKNWSLNVFVSRDIVLNTTAILAGGVYLLIMAAAGYYLREFGGSWGQVNQVVFVAFAIAMLGVLLTSARLRAQIRVFLGKHFYKNKYDYRVEWLRLTDELGGHSEDRQRFVVPVQALAQVVDARAGMLWLRHDDGYVNVACWQQSAVEAAEPLDSPLVRYLGKSGFVINLTEVDAKPAEYEGLVLPHWLEDVYQPWLVVPLRGMDGLLGFIVLANPLVQRPINWEDRDLLKTAARQISSHLSVIMTSDALAEARQFEVFSRLSAYMVHDLKNIAAELEMVAQNAKKHVGNPEFLEDAFDTVDNAASDIKRLLDHLRNRRNAVEKKVEIELDALLRQVVESKQGKAPRPVLNISGSGLMTVAEKGRLMNVLAHLIDNAQQATGEGGRVDVSLSSSGRNGMHQIDISDDGVGMDADFIRNRLFKPFDTTKGNAGMGIGMYESREFVRQLGGDVTVKSKPGKGTIISLHIPSSQPQEAQAAEMA